MKGKLRKEGICLARTEKLIKDSGVAAAGAYDEAVQGLLGAKQARGWSDTLSCKLLVT